MKFKHSIFHASFLKSAHSDITKIFIRNEYVESQKEYEIEEILNTQLIKNNFFLDKVKRIRTFRKHVKITEEF